MSGKKRKNAFREKANNSLAEQDFREILTVSESCGPPASFATKISAIAPETTSQLDFKVEKKHKTIRIETADDVIATSRQLARELSTSASRRRNRNLEIWSRTREFEVSRP